MNSKLSDAAADVIVFVLFFLASTAGSCHKQVSCDSGKSRPVEVKLLAD